MDIRRAAYLKRTALGAGRSKAMRFMEDDSLGVVHRRQFIRKIFSEGSIDRAESVRESHEYALHNDEPSVSFCLKLKSFKSLSLKNF